MRMFVLSLLAGVLFSCSGKVQEAETAYKSDLKVFIPIKGHDPVEEGVFTDPYLQHRLVKLLGQGKYDTLVQIMYDCSPIGFNHDLIYWVGYGKENPEANGGAIIIDLVNDEIYVAYEVDYDIQLFSEADNVDNRPNKLKLWLNRRENISTQADQNKEEEGNNE